MTDPNPTQSPLHSVVQRDAFELTPVPSARSTAESAARELQADEVDLRDRQYFFNRELSWMEFNDRVLQLAEQEDIPLLERVKFTAIFSSNLDEFIMIRLAGMHDLIDAGIEKRGPDGRTPDETVDGVGERARDQLARQSKILREDLIPQLAEHGIRICHVEDLSSEQREELSRIFHAQIYPVLTPLAVGPGRPFPYISNLSLSLAVLLRDPQLDQTTFARVKVPKEILPRFVRIEDILIPLEEVIADNLLALFPGTEVVACAPFRVTRDADFTVSDEADDLLRAVEDELRRRRFGEVVRVEVGKGISRALREELVESLEIEERDLYEIDGLLDLGDLWEIVKLPGHSQLREHKWSPIVPSRLRDADGEQIPILAAMREGDFLVHHPYESFSATVERFVTEAVNDPDVLAIKLTVYRTSDDSPLVPALIRASERGKQAVALVELKARFDERANIQWARELEQSGVHVVYGPPALKTHTKCLLVVRREGNGVRNYVHIGTGNYHSATARLYTDFGLFTTDPAIGADVTDMFNFLTGFARPNAMRKVLIAPSQMRSGILDQIDKTIAAHQAGVPSQIRMKMNSLVDVACIEALYQASRAGVPIELNVRGICCLRPGVPGVSENIRVNSVVGRFLEHSRIYGFVRGDERTALIGSADLMRRNLDNRVELVTPVEDEALKDTLFDCLDRSFADNSNAWELGSDGDWKRLAPETPEARRNVQDELMEIYRGHDAAFAG
ncbi:MAG: polyphosphate kinase 1 [Thermoleophilaceae bacterium]|nr:polyphosphate kinase 1 [Thermoleophilaceae bacterium]